MESDGACLVEGENETAGGAGAWEGQRGCSPCTASEGHGRVPYSLRGGGQPRRARGGRTGRGGRAGRSSCTASPSLSRGSRTRGQHRREGRGRSVGGRGNGRPREVLIREPQAVSVSGGCGGAAGLRAQ